MLKVTVVGQAGLELTLKKLVGAADVNQILDEASAILLSRIRRHFLEEVDPDGNSWTVSKAALKRANSGRGGGTLFDTGRLFHSIQLAGGDANSRYIGTDVPYGIYHQLGSGIGNIARVFLGFGDEDAAVATQLVIKRFENALK